MATATPIKQTSKLQIAAVAIIAFTVTLGSLYYFGVFDEFQAQNCPTLTPARNLEGTWKTAFPVRFYIKTDFETFGELKDVGSENRPWLGKSPRQATTTSSTWGQFHSFQPPTILRFRVHAWCFLDVPDWHNKGHKIDTYDGWRSILWKQNCWRIQLHHRHHPGNWSDHWSMLYEQEVYTATNSLILSKQ